VARSPGETVFVQLFNNRPIHFGGFPVARATTDKPERLGTHMDVVGGSVREPDGGFISTQNIRLSQARGAAGIQVAECRGDRTLRKCGWAPLPRWGMSWAAIEPATGMVVPIDLGIREYAETQNITLSSREGTRLGARCLPKENLTSDVPSIFASKSSFT